MIFQPTICLSGASLSTSSPDGPALASVIGIPFDCGTHKFRVGSRQGPDSIREQSKLIRSYDISKLGPTENPSRFLRLTDLGNVACVPGDVNQAFPLIEQAVDYVQRTGAMTIAMGGDGAVTLPQLRAVARHHPGLVVIHFDAHTDTYDFKGYNTATTFTRAVEEQLIDPKNSFHIGARGTTGVPGVIAFGRSLGFNIVPFEDYQPRPAHWLKMLREKLGRKPVYLCFDMDIFDPSCAPGVCTPEWGGLTALEGIRLLRSLAGLNFVAFDVNTVSPPHDIAGTTAFLAATVMQEFCGLAAETVLAFPERFSHLRGVRSH